MDGLTHRAHNLLKFVINTETNCGETLEGTAKVQSEKLGGYSELGWSYIYIYTSVHRPCGHMTKYIPNIVIVPNHYKS